MENFDDIIKQKVGQFEPQFNEAHWEALDQKLTNIKIAKIRKNILIGVASVVIASLGGFAIFQSTHQQETNNTTQISAQNNVVNDDITSVNTNPSTYNNQSLNKSTQLAPISVEPQQTLPLIQEEETSVQKTEIKQVLPTKEQSELPSTDKQLNGGFVVFNNKVCLGEEVSFEANDKNDLLAYTWDFGDGSSSNKQNPKYTYKQPGVYSVKLTVVNKRSSEEKSTLQKGSVQIMTLPSTDFSYVEQSTQFDDNSLKYPNTYFSCKGELTDTYEWNFGSSNSSNDKQPMVLFDKKGEYNVTLKAKNVFGCINSTTKNVTISNSFELFAPNAFTPNFDGNNDEFMPEALLTWNIKFEMSIKNKAGNIIFKTTDKNDAWKGSLNNQGSILDEGLYLWQVVTYDVDGKPYQHIGKINLIK